jgi:hypothetical protein
MGNLAKTSAMTRVCASSDFPFLRRANMNYDYCRSYLLQKISADAGTRAIARGELGPLSQSYVEALRGSRLDLRRLGIQGSPLDVQAAGAVENARAVDLHPNVWKRKNRPDPSSTRGQTGYSLFGTKYPHVDPLSVRGTSIGHGSIQALPGAMPVNAVSTPQREALIAANRQTTKDLVNRVNVLETRRYSGLEREREGWITTLAEANAKRRLDLGDSFKPLGPQPLNARDLPNHKLPPYLTGGNMADEFIPRNRPGDWRIFAPFPDLSAGSPPASGAAADAVDAVTPGLDAAQSAGRLKRMQRLRRVGGAAAAAALLGGGLYALTR